MTTFSTTSRARFSTTSRARLRHANHRAGGPGSQARDAKSSSRECVTETGIATRTKREGGGATARPRAAACRAPSGGSPTGAPPPPGRASPASAGRWYPPLRCADGRACKRGPDPSSVPGILSPVQITVKGAPAARRLLTQPQTLDAMKERSLPLPGGCWKLPSIRLHQAREAPMETAYDGRQVVGMDLHRRRSACWCG